MSEVRAQLKQNREVGSAIQRPRRHDLRRKLEPAVNTLDYQFRFRGTLEKAQAIAAHESPRTTKLYDRTSDVLTLEEIEKIAI